MPGEVTVFEKQSEKSPLVLLLSSQTEDLLAPLQVALLLAVLIYCCTRRSTGTSRPEPIEVQLSTGIKVQLNGDRPADTRRGARYESPRRRPKVGRSGGKPRRADVASRELAGALGGKHEHTSETGSNDHGGGLHKDPLRVED